MSSQQTKTVDKDIPVAHPDDLVAAPVPAVVNDAVELHRDHDSRVLDLVPTDDEWAGVDSGDLAPSATRRIPYLRLNRNLDGGFTIPDTGEITKALDFVWLAKGRSRGWYEKDWSANESGPPDCRSFDGITADPQSPELQNGGDCSTCPLAEFDDDKRGGKDVKRCREAVEALVFVPSLDAEGNPDGAGRLARVRWSGIAVRPALDYWSTFDLRMPKIPPIGFVSRATLQPTKTDFGEKLAPVFVRVKALARAEAQPLIEERDARVADWKADIAADVREGVASDDDESTPPQPGARRAVPEDEEPF